MAHTGDGVGKKELDRWLNLTNAERDAEIAEIQAKEKEEQERERSQTGVLAVYRAEAPARIARKEKITPLYRAYIRDQLPPRMMRQMEQMIRDQANVEELD